MLLCSNALLCLRARAGWRSVLAVFVLLMLRPLCGPAAYICFCNGPFVVNPLFAPVPLPGACFCTGSALGCRLMVFEEERAGPISNARGRLASVQAPPAYVRPDPIRRPGRDVASGRKA